MYENTAGILEEYGFHQYEISNYAKGGRECRHNKGYWQRIDYLGLGLGASSLLNHMRFSNTADMKDILETVRFRIRSARIWKALQRQMRWLSLCFWGFG